MIFHMQRNSVCKYDLKIIKSFYLGEIYYNMQYAVSAQVLNMLFIYLFKKCSLRYNLCNIIRK